MINSLHHIVRVGNVIIALITAGVIYAFFFYLPANRFDLDLSIGLVEFALFGVCVFLLMTGGYIINNLFDKETDAVNKPDRVNTLEHFSTSTLSYSIIFCLLIGTAISIYTAIRLDRPGLSILYPTFFAMMYLYSSKVKGKAVIDNVFIATMIASLPFLFLLVESNMYWSFYLKYEGYFFIYFYGLIFLTGSIFLTTLIREAIKDIEDIQGDKAAQIMTFPVRYGIEAAAILSSSYIIVFLFGFVAWLIYVFEYLSLLIVLSTVTPIIFLLGFTLYILATQTKASYFSLASFMMKLLMICGILHIVLVVSSI